MESTGTTLRVCLLQRNECNYSVDLKSLCVPVGKCCIHWAFLPTWKLCPVRALWLPVAFVPNWSLDQSLERPVCCFSGPNKSELGHLKDLRQTLLKSATQKRKGQNKKEGTTAQKNPCQGFTSFSLAVQLKDAFNWFLSVVVCQAGEPECYKGLKTYILWWFRRQGLKSP